MDIFLELFNLGKLNDEEIENPNRLVTSKETESVIKNFPTNESLGLDGITGEYDQTFKQELIPILLKLFEKTEAGEYFQSHFMRPGLPEHQCQTRTPQKKKIPGQYPCKTGCKNSQQNLSKLNATVH